MSIFLIFRLIIIFWLWWEVLHESGIYTASAILSIFLIIELITHYLRKLNALPEILEKHQQKNKRL